MDAVTVLGLVAPLLSALAGSAVRARLAAAEERDPTDWVLAHARAMLERAEDVGPGHLRGQVGGLTLDVEVENDRRYAVWADAATRELTVRIEKAPDDDARPADAEPFVVEGAPAERVDAVLDPVRAELRVLANRVVFQNADVRDGRVTVRAAPYANDPAIVQSTLLLATRLALAVRAAAAGGYRDGAKRGAAVTVELPSGHGKLEARPGDVWRSFRRGLINSGRWGVFLFFLWLTSPWLASIGLIFLPRDFKLRLGWLQASLGLIVYGSLWWRLSQFQL